MDNSFEMKIRVKSGAMEIVLYPGGAFYQLISSQSFPIWVNLGWIGFTD